MATRRNEFGIRLEYSAEYPREVWVYDEVQSREHCKIVHPDELGAYVTYLLGLSQRLDAIKRGEIT